MGIPGVIGSLVPGEKPLSMARILLSVSWLLQPVWVKSVNVPRESFGVNLRL